MMTELSIETIGATKITIPPDDLQALRAALRGTVCTAGDAGYDEARTIWNAMIDRRPGLVIRCQEAGDVQRAVDLARKHDLVLAVRGGGHNIAGSAVCDGGLLIDLSPMRSVKVDAAAKRASVGPGATLADVDRETQAFGLALPTGINSTTGIAGLTLGGGFGWLTRKFGMTIDNLISADVVTADGRMLRASESENPDLFWAIRGGGGNFGIVTNFEFRLHAGRPAGPFGAGRASLRRCQGRSSPHISRSSPRRPTTSPAGRSCARPRRCPFIPAEWHGNEVLILAMIWAGDMAEGEKAMAELRALGKPIADVVSPHPVRRLAGGLRSAAHARAHGTTGRRTISSGSTPVCSIR